MKEISKTTWILYEARKRELIESCLTPEEYESEVLKLAEELGIV